MKDNLRIATKINKAENNFVMRSEKMMEDTEYKFKQMVDKFEEQVKQEILKWRHNNINLEHKYEACAAWTITFQSLVGSLKEELFHFEDSVKTNFTTLAKLIHF